MGRTDGDHGRQADGRGHRVAAADPIPHGKHLLGRDAEGSGRLGVGRDSDEVARDRGLVMQLAQAPGARRPRIGQRLQRAEALGADDEQRLCGIEAARGFGQRGAVDVGDERQVQVALAVVLQRLIRHHRAEVGAADADVDHMADGLAGVAAPGAAADLLAEGGHSVQHRMHLGDDVDAVDPQLLARGRTQGRVQHRALFGRVDHIAAKHRGDVLGQAAVTRQRRQQRDGLAVDPLLRIVEVQPGGLDGPAGTALGVRGKQVPQVRVAHVRLVRHQRLPGRPGADRASCPQRR